MFYTNTSENISNIFRMSDGPSLTLNIKTYRNFLLLIFSLINSRQDNTDLNRYTKPTNQNISHILLLYKNREYITVYKRKKYTTRPGIERSSIIINIYFNWLLLCVFRVRPKSFKACLRAHLISINRWITKDDCCFAC